MSKKNKVFEKYINNPEEFLDNVSLKLLEKMIKYAKKKYYSDSQIISDDLYDLLEDKLRDLDPNNPLLKQVGTKIEKHDKTKKDLPYHMGSLSKIKYSDIDYQKKLDLFAKKYPGPYIISDKLDGVSALLHIRDNIVKLYKRGDEKKGTDISSLIPYINNLKLGKKVQDLTIRGELVIKKKIFKKFSDKYSNERAMISGITNAKTIDPKLLKTIDFVAYDVIYPRKNIYSKSFNILKKYNITIVPGTKSSKLNGQKLSKYLILRENKSEYDIDGLVIHDNSKIHKLVSSGNPKYAIAFKGKDEMVKAKVIKVDWRLSRYAKSKPRLILEPVLMPDNKTVTFVTAHNAKFIFDNGLGPGSIIGIVLSGKVIPKIVKIFKKTKVNEPDVPYQWNSSKVDILLKKSSKKNTKVLIQELLFFVKTLKIKYLNISTIKKFVDLNYDSFDKILNLATEDLLKVEGYEEKMAKKIYLEITKARKNITLLKLMVASGIFGHGFGKKKIDKILSVHPNIHKLNKFDFDRIVELLNNIEGFSNKTSEKFAEKLPKFISFLDDFLKKTNIKLSKEKKIKTETFKKLAEMKIVFTGFRDKNLQSIIENSGGKVTTTVSSKTDLLVVKDINASGSKINKAKKLNIKIIDVDTFKKKYFK